MNIKFVRTALQFLLSEVVVRPQNHANSRSNFYKALLYQLNCSSHCVQIDFYSTEQVGICPVIYLGRVRRKVRSSHRASLDRRRGSCKDFRSRRCARYYMPRHSGSRDLHWYETRQLRPSWRASLRCHRQSIEDEKSMRASRLRIAGRLYCVPISHVRSWTGISMVKGLELDISFSYQCTTSDHALVN